MGLTLCSTDGYQTGAAGLQNSTQPAGTCKAASDCTGAQTCDAFSSCTLLKKVGLQAVALGRRKVGQCSTKRQGVITYGHELGKNMPAMGAFDKAPRSTNKLRYHPLPACSVTPTPGWTQPAAWASV